MDKIDKIISGFLCSGVLSAGLFGLYYFHKKQIPVYMGVISFCITCLGLYAMGSFIFEDEPEDNKDKEPKPVRTKRMPGTPKPKKAYTLTRELLTQRMPGTPKPKKSYSLTREEFLSVTDKLLDNFTDEKEKQEGREFQAEIGAHMLKAENKNKIIRLKKTSFSFEDPEATRKSGITKHALPKNVKMPDLINESSATGCSKPECTSCLKDFVNDHN